ncbi:unextended protein isoform X2 [Anopheles gambiae]|uniref:unextended protein isoform X2 n=1 Tax=Anopheles gambiae TaxID=7165 RepID=UPI002AC94D6C|nr:unextended protein isoform X2 [Anopheles gambiae]
MARAGRWAMLKIIAQHLTAAVLPLLLLAGATWRTVDSKAVVDRGHDVGSPEMQPIVGGAERVAIVTVVPGTGGILRLYGDAGDGRTFLVDRVRAQCHEQQLHVVESFPPGVERSAAAVPAMEEEPWRGATMLCWSLQGNVVELVIKEDAQIIPVLKTDLPSSTDIGSTNEQRSKRNIDKDSDANSIIHVENPETEEQGTLRIEGYRIENSELAPERDENDVPSVRINTQVQLRLFGTGITRNVAIIFTHETYRFGGPCQVPVTEKFHVTYAEPNGRSGLVEIELPEVIKNKKYFYMCAKYESVDPLEGSDEYDKEASKVNPFLHQGSDMWLRMTSHQPLLPLWLSITVIAVCLMFSALFSGLNLGLMSLDKTDLQILCNTGSDKEKEYARAIQPVRKHGNYLLCSILLGNVLVNSTFTILLDSLTSGLFAVIGSTVAIVIFGEIIPQAICSRHGLAVGAKTIYITRAFMMLTYPVSYPTSKILDLILGKEIGNFYDRDRLKELVQVTKDVNDLDKDEVNVISGVLELRKKKVEDVMTRLEDAYMLPMDAVMDFETISEIMQTGYSRIPVYEGERTNIKSILHIKDLAFVDPDDNTPIRQICEFYGNRLHFVFFDQTLDVMFKEFKSGEFGHMAFIQNVNSEGEGDPYYYTLGLITLEDVIEELIQAEIVDETDVFTDNQSKVPRKRIKRQGVPLFGHRSDKNMEVQRIRIGPQLLFATYQFISTGVTAFTPSCISETILRRLLSQNIFHHIKIKSKTNNERVVIIERGTAIDHFVLILEGRVEVTVGKENLLFESGPFTYYGLQAIVQSPSCDTSTNTPQQILGSLESINRDANSKHVFIPDYTVKAITDVLYLQIHRNLYLAAKRATLMERKQKLGDQSMDPIDAEVEQLMHSLDKADQNSITPDATNLTVNSGAKASKSSSDVASPITALNDPINNTNSSVTPRNHIVLEHDNSSSAAAANDINIGASTSYGNEMVVAGDRDTDPSSAPLLPKP